MKIMWKSNGKTCRNIGNIPLAKGACSIGFEKLLKSCKRYVTVTFPQKGNLTAASVENVELNNFCVYFTIALKFAG